MPLEQADPELYGIIKDEKHRQRYVEDGMARTGGRAGGRAGVANRSRTRVLATAVCPDACLRDGGEGPHVAV
jgi:hypothetical protein